MTDQRREAERWLERAHDDEVDIESPVAQASLLWDIRSALIGIGHALLAAARTPPGTFTIPPGLTTAVTTSTPATPTESQRCIARHGDLRCVFWAGHKDPHRGTWTGEPEEDVSA